MCDYLITGVAGFVGKYLVDALIENSPNAIIVGTDMSEPHFGGRIQGLAHFEKTDLLDFEALHALVQRWRPRCLVHLASYSSVAFSWEKPSISFLNNTNIFLNVLEAIREVSPKTRILSVGSSEEYGSVHEADVPLKESRELRPTSPYGVARVSQEQLSRVYCGGFNLDIVLTRSFNHIGPGQRDAFVVSSFVKQFAAALREGKKEFNLQVGNVDIVRDFTDVRDVVRAYRLLLDMGRTNELYNVCSGRGYALREIISLIAEITKITPIINVDNERIRPSENPIIIGDNSKLLAICGWSPEREIRKTLADMVEYWLNEP